jgi:hypothetical protein
VQSMGLMRSDDSYGGLMRSIHDALDPGDIMAPGRYRA